MPIVIGAGGPSDRAYLPLATRRGAPIPNERRLERAPASLRAAYDLFRRERPNARLRSATAVYNCMGMAFASRRTWIDTSQLGMILQDDDYRRLDGPHEAHTGDLVVYRKRPGGAVSHVSVIVRIEPMVQTVSWEIITISQWGADGEYLHRVDDVPDLLGEPVEYWTDRRPVP